MRGSDTVVKLYDLEEIRCLKAIDALGRAELPWIVSPRAWFCREGRVMLVENRVQGESLRDFVLGRKSACYGLDDFDRLLSTWEGRIRQALKALHSLKPNGIIHGDVSPGNILVHPRNTAFLIDFNRAFFSEETRGQAPGQEKGCPYASFFTCKETYSEKGDFIALSQTFRMAKRLERSLRGFYL